jgi:hypothetical protein
MAVRKEDDVLVVEGRVTLQEFDAGVHELPLRAFAFDSAGRLIGSGDVNEKGTYRFPVSLTKPADVEVIVGPAVEADIVRDAEPPSSRFSAKDWTRSETAGFRLSPQIQIARPIWWPWRPIRVCVRGRIRKVESDRPPCPVPFTQVEVYDVDRESCLWPYLRPRLPDLFDKPILRLPELIKPGPIPEPDPIGPIAGLAGRLDRVALNPQPLPPRSAVLDAAVMKSQPLAPGSEVAFNPQPDPPFPAAMLRVGELKTVSESIASRLEGLTITSRLAPWLIWPRCFFSKAVVCKTTTDCDGRFRCCFWWWPWHVRNGRLRFDSRPDLIIKATQIIGGSSRVIYLDPYTSTRWDSWGAYIDLLLDDEDIVCGTGCTPTPDGPAVFFVRVGNDEVYKINQANGLFDETPFGGPYSNMAYGSSLNLHAVFGDALSLGGPQFYYRLSIAGPTTGGAFKNIKTKLTDTRVNKATLFSDDYDLGPFTVGTTEHLYKVRDTANFYWYNQDWIGSWYTSWAGDLDTLVPDEGQYTVRLEVFDSAGVKQTSATVDYRDGTAAPPAVLPAMVDSCDLIIHVDNKAPTVSLSFPAVVNPCGVVPITATPFNFTAHIHQENGRLHSWGLGYVKGLNIASGTLAAASSNSGLATPVNQLVSSAPMTAGLTGTCAFALTIGAWSHIRNGYSLVYHVSQPYALAVEHCG